MHQSEVVFQFRLNQQHKDELNRLADYWRCSRAEVVRRLIRGAHDHVYQDAPACADGGRCFVPHMHQKKGAAV